MSGNNFDSLFLLTKIDQLDFEWITFKLHSISQRKISKIYIQKNTGIYACRSLLMNIECDTSRFALIKYNRSSHYALFLFLFPLVLGSFALDVFCNYHFQTTVTFSNWKNSLPNEWKCSTNFKQYIYCYVNHI